MLGEPAAATALLQQHRRRGARRATADALAMYETRGYADGSGVEPPTPFTRMDIPVRHEVARQLDELRERALEQPRPEPAYRFPIGLLSGAPYLVGGSARTGGGQRR